MKLSIIIPSFNTEKLLSDCLTSIFQQTKSFDYEVIVVDNGSEYDIKNQISRFRQKNLKQTNIQLIVNNSNLGFAKACNQGIKKAKGEYLLFLNSDTLILDKAIEKSIKLMDSRLNIDILGCQILNPDFTIQPSAGFFPKLRNIFYMIFFIDDLPLVNKLIKPYHQQNRKFYTKEQEVDWVTGAFLMIKKDYLKKIRGFDESYFMYAEEIDLCFRAKKAGFRVFYSPMAKIIHYKEASSRIETGNAVLLEYQGLINFFKKNKAKWKIKYLKFFLKAGAFLRMLIFGILIGDANKKEIYWKAYRMVR